MKAVLGLALALVVALQAPPATAESHGESIARIGVLQCVQIPGRGFNIIVHSKSVFDCVMISPEGRERYVGESGVGFGLDLEWTRDKAISYAVFAIEGSAVIGEYALTGTYVGGRASAAGVVGAGAQVLLGGGPRNVSLQPVALESFSGLGASAGIGYLSLKPARPTPPPRLDPVTGQAWSAPSGPMGFSYR
jgi:hypothetical protein